MTTLSPLLADDSITPEPPRPYARRWIGCAAIAAAAGALTWSVAARWFDPQGPGRAVYWLHDEVALPAYGRLWTAPYPYGALWLIPVLLLATVALIDYLSGWSLPRMLHRAAILWLTRGEKRRGLLRRLHRHAGRRGSFIIEVVARETAGAVEAALDRPGHVVRAWTLTGLQAQLLIADPERGDVDPARVLARAALLIHATGRPAAATMASLRAALDAIAVPTDVPKDTIVATMLDDVPIVDAIGRAVREAGTTLEQRIAALDNGETVAPGAPAWLHYHILIAAAAALHAPYRLAALAAFDAVERLGIAALLAGRSDEAADVAAAMRDTDCPRLAAFAAGRFTSDVASAVGSSWAGRTDTAYLAGAVAETASRPADFVARTAP